MGKIVIIFTKQITYRYFLSLTYRGIIIQQNKTKICILNFTAVCFISLIVWLQRYKVKCLNQIVGKRLTNDHDLEIVNVKRSSSYGEDEIEMSAILHDRTVILSIKNTNQTSFSPEKQPRCVVCNGTMT